MTAEVVIMNKQGMALAADSAITREDVKKVYNTANKLFSLSEEQPVGIMVYGAASFMEIPWEVIIKSYRKYVGERTFSTLQQYMDDFLDFLRHDDRFKNPQTEEVIIYRTFSGILKQIVREIDADINQREEEATNNTVLQLMEQYIDENIDLYQKKDKVIEELNFIDFEENYRKVISEIEEDLISFEITETLKEKLMKLAYEAVKSNYFSLGSSGFVIAGYGEKDLFPHLLNYRLEGFVLSQLKYTKELEKQISYTNQQLDGTAAVVPFAQKEMIDSFMGGIEPLMQDAIFNIVEKVLTDYPAQIQKHVDISFSKDHVSAIEKLGKDVYHSINDAVWEYKQSNYIEPLLSIVRSLPKEDLADMAETLINLTSFKRRVSSVTESVGPPVDVAIITKGDGFVWRKRKNFINNELNARL
ncbi:hypothetical protein SAMN04487944_107137 [Gracilibacillus ureilyticus]|uniref:Uncharacterized protein n=1 Tax=Gracilibacillus ureilyticus TaxID=531814 RepID=A0A1H9QWY4_9BACI|nr:hypothetical protein [Gracilibacillus ureilyticus]SER64940.1 hypothetical protein SAMN04487944_107137 [Gracilibacillus ureilyticus]